VEGGEEAVGVGGVGGVGDAGAGVVLPHSWARKRREVMEEVDTLDKGLAAASARQ
jgi:hypothetical protein